MSFNNLKVEGFIKSPKNPFFKNTGNNQWDLSHAMLPIFGSWIAKNKAYIFYCSRNEKNQSNIGKILVEIKEDISIKIKKIYNSPILTPGELGCFDDNGVSPSSYVINEDGTHFLYYIGWKPRSSTRFSLIAGLAKSYDGEVFERNSKGPLLFQSNEEPLSILTAPWVIFDNGIYRMWYVSGVRWINEDLPKYNIKYAESNDGIKWNQTGKIALDNHNGFTSIARPCVLKMKNIYYMWYSAKKPNTEYEIYCASSNDGIIWDYQNKINLSYGLSTSTGKDMWDSEMVEYAHVSLYEKNLIMLFNGNKYGLSGMGLAYKKIN